MALSVNFEKWWVPLGIIRVRTSPPKMATAYERGVRFIVVKKREPPGYFFVKKTLETLKDELHKKERWNI
jgi:hypothetical protein